MCFPKQLKPESADVSPTLQVCRRSCSNLEGQCIQHYTSKEVLSEGETDRHEGFTEITSVIIQLQI
jgi:hypothetical protein